MKKVIRDFSRENYSNLEKRVVEAHEDLLRCQDQTLSNPNLINADLELEAQTTWSTLQKAEEGFFLQRSRLQRLKDGDSNTKYFHRMADSRYTINHILYLYDDQGTKIETEHGIGDLCVNYFSNLLGGESPTSALIQSDMDLLLPFRCTSDQKRNLEMDFTDSEVKQAFLALPRNKTSGPDGYSAEFFSQNWDIVGHETRAAVQEFFRSGQLLSQWNATTLVLIPKTPNASTTSEFRPISCLNTVYKVIARLLSARLQLLLSQVISPAQSAFLSGRSLSENVLLTTELIQGYNRSNIEPRGFLKVDLKKAFDSLN